MMNYLVDLLMLSLAFGLVGMVYIWLARPARIVNPFCTVGERLTFRLSLTESLT